MFVKAMFIKAIVVTGILCLVSIRAGAEETALRTYNHFNEPEIPVSVEEVSDPLILEAVFVGKLSCEDYSGAGVKDFLRSGKHPKKYSTGKFVVRATKPSIKRQKRYVDGTPGHLTVRSFKESCLNNLIRNKNQSKADKAAVSGKMKNLRDTVNTLNRRVEELESRVRALEEK